jgi:hypothetical protein
MTDEELMRCFEAGTVPAGGFHHAQHVRAAWNYVTRCALPEALERFCSALKRFAEAQGKPDLYHATITVAYLLLINERVDRSSPEAWQDFAARNADLLTWKPSILDRYYTADTLSSDRARRRFVMPDRISALDSNQDSSTAPSNPTYR